MNNVFIPELNIWNNVILSETYNVDKNFLNKSSIDISTYESYVYEKSFQHVLFKKTYDFNTFNIFYKESESISNSPRLQLYYNLSGYISDNVANENIIVPPFDSTGNISTDIISDSQRLPKSDNTTNMSYNIFEITYEEYYFIEKIKKYKTGINITLSDVEHLSLISNFTKMLYSFLQCEINNEFPLTPLPFDFDSRLIEQLYLQYITNHFYLKKQLCDKTLLNSETHFYIPISVSKIIVLTNENIQNGYITLTGIPIDINHINCYYNDLLISNNNIETNEENNTFKFYWNQSISQELESNDKFYLVWSTIPQDINMVL